MGDREAKLNGRPIAAIYKTVDNNGGAWLSSTGPVTVPPQGKDFHFGEGSRHFITKLMDFQIPLISDLEATGPIGHAAGRRKRDAVKRITGRHETRNLTMVPERNVPGHGCASRHV